MFFTNISVLLPGGGREYYVRGLWGGLPPDGWREFKVFSSSPTSVVCFLLFRDHLFARLCNGNFSPRGSRNRVVACR